MRIVGGTHKGRKLNPPSSLPIRPTTDRAREGIFNMLAHRLDFEDVHVLDLFAGSGAVSLEFGSRGCPEVVAVDQHPGCVSYIGRMAAELGLPVKPYRSEAFGFVRKWKKPNAFDLVFADPPYQLTKERIARLADLLWEGEVIRKEGILIVEHPVQYDLEDHPRFHSHRDYGSSRFSFLGELD